MSSPQQPWSTGRPTSPDQPHATAPTNGYAPHANGCGAPQDQPVPEAYGAGGPTGELVLNLRRPVGAMGMKTLAVAFG